MHCKQTSSGMTLLEIMCSLAIAGLILAYLIPQQLNTTRTQMINQTVAEMNQIILAARNDYQDSRTASPTAAPATLWPQALGDLTNSNYLPTAALCSPWPSATNDATCGYHQPYTLFPANATGVYDTTAVGIAASGSNKGGNFWGVSVTLPNAAIAQTVQQKLPFASLCNPTQLKTGSACTSANTSNTVTAIAPRPATWPQANNSYSPEGLVQYVTNVKGCSVPNPNSSGNGRRCDYPGSAPYAYQSNLTNRANWIYSVNNPVCQGGTTPVIYFTNPLSQSLESGYAVTASTNSNQNPGRGYYFPGYAVKITKDTTNNRWLIQRRYASDTRSTSVGTIKMYDFSLLYFITCAPAGDPGKWDPSNFPGTNANSSYDLLWPDTYV